MSTNHVGKSDTTIRCKTIQINFWADKQAMVKVSKQAMVKVSKQAMVKVSKQEMVKVSKQAMVNG